MNRVLWGVIGFVLVVGLYLVEAENQRSRPVPGKPVPAFGMTPSRKFQVEATQVVADEWLIDLKAGLLPQDRNQLKWYLSTNGQTGVRKRLTLDMDCRHRGGSQALTMLQHFACTSERSIVIYIDEPLQTFQSLIGAAVGRRVEAIPFEDHFGVGNYVGDGVSGQFLPPLAGPPVPNVVYSATGEAEIHLQRDLPSAEAVATAYHELYHAFTWSIGSPWRHGEAAGVNPAIQRLEREVRENSTK